MASVLPGPHYNLLVYMVAFGRELLHPENSEKNLLNADSLAFILSRAMMRPVPHDCALAHCEAGHDADHLYGMRHATGTHDDSGIVV